MLAFLAKAVRNYRTTGAVCPSSGILAREMTRAVRQRTGPKRVLEIGPGTGAFTRAVLSALQPGDEFHLVEINADFAEHLRAEVLDPFIAVNPQIQVLLYVAPIEDARIDGRFDAIICGLPFNNFPLSTVSRIFRKMLSLMKEGGDLAYFEYVGMKAVKWPWVGPHGRSRLRRRIAMEQSFARRYNGRRDVVFRNFTPARAIHLSGSACAEAGRCG